MNLETEGLNEVCGYGVMQTGILEQLAIII